MFNVVTIDLPEEYINCGAKYVFVNGMSMELIIVSD